MNCAGTNAPSAGGANSNPTTPTRTRPNVPATVPRLRASAAAPASRKRPPSPRRSISLAAAIILAQVREDDRSAPVARQLGASGPDQRAVMSPLRLSRLLTADTIEDRLVAFRRVVALLGGRAHVPNLATALLDWSERTRIIWAFDYHNVPSPGTADFTTPTQEAGDAR
jgi:CRISPR type I-E-associated protein CasB/Cse2